MWSGRRALLILAVGLAAALVGSGLGVLLDAPGGAVGEATVFPSPTPSPIASVAPSPSSAEPSPSAEPTASHVPTATPLPSGPAVLSWSEGAAPAGEVNATAWAADRWLAVGSEQLRAAAWTSLDGVTWHPAAPIPPDPIPITSDGEPGAGYWIRDVIEYESQLLAFGWSRIGCCDAGAPMLWRSVDGASWSVVETGGTGFDTYQSPYAAVIAPDGALVIVSALNLGTSSAAFITTDLVSWEQHAITDASAPSGVTAVAGSPSLLLGIGYRDGGVAGWSSRDGRSWSEIDLPDAAAAFGHGGSTWDPVRQRFLIGGEDTDGRATIWLSADLASWTTITLSDEPGRVDGIDAADDGLVVASGGVGPADARDVLAWSSHDGITWQIANLGASLGASHVATGPSGATIVMNGVGGEPDYEYLVRSWHGAR